jgi:hypothetical protein
MHVIVIRHHAEDAPGFIAYTPRQYTGPADQKLVAGQASDRAAWWDSLQRIRGMAPARVHFCHHTGIIHS